MGIGICEIQNMPVEALDRLLADVMAFDPAVFSQFTAKYEHAVAMKLMRDVHGLVQLGYPRDLAIAEAENIFLTTR